MAEGDEQRLRRLGERIGTATAASDASRPARGSFSQGELAWRMVIELVTGLVIGLGIGFGLDALFGTRPLFLVVFVMVGLAAGVRVMLQTARSMTPPVGDAAAKASAASGAKDAMTDGGTADGN